MEKHLVSDSNCNIVMYNAQISLLVMTNTIRFTISVSDTTQVVYN